MNINTRIKKSLSLLLAIIMTLSILPTAFPLTASAVESDYTISNSGLITAYNGGETVVLIPETIDGRVVTGIGTGVFSSNANKKVTSVTIPATVKTIAQSAFGGTSGGYALETVIFAQQSQLTSIDVSAFQYCTKLCEIVIPASVTSIEGNAFNGCSALASVTFENGSNLTKIGLKAFTNTAIASIIIPDKVESVLGNAFQNCSALTKVTVLNPLTTFTASAFSSCTLTIYGYKGSTAQAYAEANIGRITFEELEAVTNSDFDIDENGFLIAYNGSEKDIIIPDWVNGHTIVGIADGVFSTDANKSITSVTIPANVETIGAQAFGHESDDSELTSVIFAAGSKLMTIGNAAFQNCTKLLQITIPASVTSIADNAFNGCVSLSTITLEENGKLREIGHNAFEGCVSLTSFMMPSTLTNIGTGIFKDCKNLSTVSLGKLTVISDEMFSGCKNLETISIPNSIASIGDNSFYNTGLKVMSLPETIKSIGEYSFRSTPVGLEITIYNPALVFAEDAFYGCTMTMYGYSNSTAQAYANTKSANITFTSISGDPRMRLGNLNFISSEAFDTLTTIEGTKLYAGSLAKKGEITETIFSSEIYEYDYYVNLGTKSISISLTSRETHNSENLRLLYKVDEEVVESALTPVNSTWNVSIDLSGDNQSIELTISTVEFPEFGTTYTVNILPRSLTLLGDDATCDVWAVEGYYSKGDKKQNTALMPMFSPSRLINRIESHIIDLYIHKNYQEYAIIDFTIAQDAEICFADSGEKNSEEHRIVKLDTVVVTEPGKRAFDVYRVMYKIPDTTGVAPILPTIPSISIISTKNRAQTFKFALAYRSIYDDIFTPDLSVGMRQGDTRQYGNDGYGANGAMTAIGAWNHYISLGGIGGFATYKYDTPIKNDPKNPYGIDFTVIGNNFGAFPEPGSVEVSKDGVNWYYLAGALHYELPLTIENVALAFGVGYGDAPDNIDTIVAFTNKLSSFGGASSISFGYMDVALVSKNANAEGEYWIPGEPRNPYTDNATMVIGDVMDISWAVDEYGKPVYLDEISYIRVQNINDIGSSISVGYVSPELGTIVYTEKYQKEASVDVTEAPNKLLVAGVDILNDTTPMDVIYSYDDEGNGTIISEYYEITGKDHTAVMVDIKSANNSTNIFVNNEHYNNEGTYTGLYASEGQLGLFNAKGELMVRVIVQRGDLQPHIYVIKVTGGDPDAAKKSAELSSVVLMPGDGSLNVNEKGEYTATVDGDTLTGSLVVSALNPNATMTLTDKNETVNISSGSQTDPYILAVGENKFTVTVTSEDESAKKEYTIIVTREEPEPIPEGEAITVTLTVEQLTLRKGFIVEPINLTVRKGTNAAQALELLLVEQGIRFKNTGSVKNMFYLSGIKTSDGDIDGDGWLGEKETGYLDSGWMFTWNNKFPELGSSDCILSDGDVIRWQYTRDKGDLGVDGDNLGESDLANKDALIRKVAQINAAGTKSEYDSIYDYALTELVKLNATQNAVNSMLSALTGKDPIDDSKLRSAISSTNSFVSAVRADAGKLIGNAAGQFPQAALTTLEQAIAAAQSVLNNTNATQAEFNAAVTALEAAVKAFTDSKTLASSWLDVYDWAVGTIRNNTSSPIVGSVGGEWAVIALARAYPNEGGAISEAAKNNYLTNLRNKLKSYPTGAVIIDPKSPTENERIILALTALGYDASSFEGYDFVTPLKNTDWVKSQGVNSSIFALIALDSKPYAVDTSVRTALINDIISQQTFGIGGLANVGWTSGTAFEPDITAMALQALAPHRSEAGVSDAIDKGLSGLSKWFTTTDYTSASSESYSQTIVALSALGINPNATTGDFAKNGESALNQLLKFAMANGSFQHITTAGGNTMATEQAGYALAAYHRYTRSGATSLYDMSDKFAPQKSTNTGVSSVKVSNIAATLSGTNTYTVELPYGTALNSLTAANVVVTATDTKASVGTATKSNGGATWTVVVTAEDGTTKTTYTITVTVATNPNAANAKDVADAKAALSSTLTVAQATVEDATTAKTWVDSQIASTLSTYGVSGTVTISAFNAAKVGELGSPNGTNGSFTATVALSKGAGDTLATDNATISVTITATAYSGPSQDDLDAQAVAAAKMTVSGATSAWVSSTVNTRDGIASWIQGEVNGFNLGANVNASVNVSAFTAAQNGTAQNKIGTAGSYTAVITISKGNKSDTVSVSGTLPADNFVSSDAGITSVSVNGTAGAISGTTITVVLPYTTLELPQNSGAIAIAMSDADATYSTPQTSDGGTTWTFTVTAQDGNTTATYTINVTIAADPSAGNAADISAAASVIESHDWTVSAGTDVNEAWLESELNKLSLNNVIFTVTAFNVTPAIAGYSNENSGIAGSYTATISLEKGENEESASGTATISGTILAAPYVKSSDASITGITVAGEVATGSGQTYAVTLPADTTVTADDFVVTANDANANVGTATNSGGDDWTVIVTAEDGTALTYTITVTITVTSEPETQKTLESITVTPPNKLVYALGERLSVTGLVVTANYSDGSSEPVATYTLDWELDDRLIVAGKKTVTVEYQGKTTTFDVTVNEANKTELANQIGLAPTTNNSNWSTNTYNTLKTALENAKRINDDANSTQTDVDVAAKTLKDAIANLQVVTDSNKIKVSLWLIGSTTSSGDVDFLTKPGDFKGAEYKTWITEQEYELEPGATVYDLLKMIDGTRGLQIHVRDNNNYLDYMYAPTVVGGYKMGEFTNGRHSGWMYTRNGYHPSLGISEQTLSDGDTIIFHYVNDHRFETSDTPYSQGSTYANRWLNAANRWPTSADGNTVDRDDDKTTGNDTTKTDDDTEIDDDKTPLADAPDNSVDTEIEATVTGNKAVATVDTAAVKEMIVTANTESKSNITLTVTNSGNASTIELDLTVETINDLAKSKMSLTVQTDSGTVIFDTASLATIAEGKADSEKVRVVVEVSVTLTTAQKAIVGNNPVIDLTVWAGNTQIHNFKGTITVKLPKLPNGVSSADRDLLTVYYLADDGSIKEMKDARYNAATGEIIFTTNHFSTYFVSEWINPFKDISKTDWFYRNVHFAYRNELMTGTAADVFSAQTNLTRAQLVTILARQAGVDTNGGANWYTKAWDWAISVKLTDGTNPEGTISREQMVTMLYRFAVLQGKSVSKTTSLDGYTDANQVSDWAKDATAWAVANGLMTGRTLTTLVPQGTATRAETSALLQRFIENLR